MNPVRLYGDPFGEDAAARALRGFLRVCLGSGFDVRLALPCLVPSRGGASAVDVELHDGARTFTVPTMLPPAEIELVARALRQPVPATSPVVVFAARRDAATRHAEAALQWPLSCKLLDGAEVAAMDLLARVQAELRWAGTEDPHGCGDAASLRAWLRLPGPAAGGAVLHVGTGDLAADGSDVAVRVFAERFAAAHRLRVVLPPGSDETAAALAAIAAEAGPACAVLGAIEFVQEPFAPRHLDGIAVALQPLRVLRDRELLARLLAAGVPLAATRWQATAELLATGACLPVGGRLLPAEAGAPPCCEPHPRSVAAALRQGLGDPAAAAATGSRGREHLVEHVLGERPAAPPVRALPRRDRPVVVLEAPLLETSSSSGLTIDTARALLRRDNVELRLVPRVPFAHDLATFAARCPELLPLLDGAPRGADLWLAAGWPPRAARPACRTFALRVDQEHGALPLELCPLVPQEADVVVVHGTHVFRTMTAAGVPADRLAVIPHGVHGDVFHEHAEPLPEIVAWKGALPAVLFAGGMVFRKGIDVLLRAALAAHASGRRFAIVVKAVGSDRHYAGFHLGELVERFARTPGAPPLLLLDRELPAREMAGVFRACDLLCHPYRGEGFGLPVLEARACGLPVLVTAGGATDDFAQGPGVVRLPASRRAVDLPQPCTSQPWLLEPDAEAAGALLAEALDGLAALRDGALRMAPVVRQQCTWDAAAAAIERLANLATARRTATVPRPRAVAPIS